MATLRLPDNSNEVVDNIRSDVKSELSASNPYRKDSILKAITTGLGRRIYDYYVQFRNAFKIFFPNTATGEWLDMWASFKNLSPDVASPATGDVVFTGTTGTTIPAGTIVKIDGIEYETQASVDIADNSISVSNLTRSGTVATCVTDDPHNLATGLSITISGVTNDTNWNATWSNISVTGLQSFTFDVPASLISPASGTIICDFTSINVEVEATSDGTETNQDGGVTLTLDGVITGVNSDVITTFAGLQGGANDETEEEFQTRVGEQNQNPQTPFNPATIERTIKEADRANTRVFVYRAYPEAGEVTITFVRDNDASIIPSAAEELVAFNAIEPIIPGNTDPDDVHLSGPTPVSIDISITGLVPNTVTMQAAVSETIESYFRGNLSDGEDMEVAKLKSAIFQTYDVVEGQAIETFNLDTPIIDQQVNIGEIAVEGTVTIGA